MPGTGREFPMTRKGARMALGLGILAVFFLARQGSRAQVVVVPSGALTAAADTQQTMSVSLSAGPVQQQSPANKPPAELPNAPSGGTAPPSLDDLGFTPQQTQANAQMQALLEKRTHMLKLHQTLGLRVVTAYEW